MRTNKRKLFYVPGLISLFFLPFIYIYLSNNEVKQRNLSVLKLFAIDTALLNNIFIVDKSFTKQPFLPKRNYLYINLNGNNQEDVVKLEFAKLKIREIIKNNDAENGIHFEYLDSANYWTFVKAIDILQTESAKRYLSIDNDIWFFHQPPDTTKIFGNDNLFTCGTYYSINKIDWLKNSKQQIILYWENGWAIILAFTCFVTLIFLKKLF